MRERIGVLTETADPTREDQQESEADPDASPDEVDQRRALLQLVDAGTEEPDDCYFGLWEGWGSGNRHVDGHLRYSPRRSTPCAVLLPVSRITGGGRDLGRGRTRERRDLGPIGVLAGGRGRG
jgi:hypothetical protein